MTRTHITPRIRTTWKKVAGSEEPRVEKVVSTDASEYGAGQKKKDEQGDERKSDSPATEGKGTPTGQSEGATDKSAVSEFGFCVYGTVVSMALTNQRNNDPWSLKYVHCATTFLTMDVFASPSRALGRYHFTSVLIVCALVFGFHVLRHCPWVCVCCSNL